MKNIKYFIILAVGLLTLHSCETVELDKKDNPNALSPSQADINLTMNAILVRTGSFTNTIGSYGSRFTRIRNMFGVNYQNVFSPATFDGVWNQAYADIMNDIRAMNAQIEGLDGEFEKHRAVGEVIEAYLIVTLVDYFGSIPYSEALDTSNLTPQVDEGSAVYQAALDLLDDAIVKFQQDTTVDLANDFYYDNDYGKWVKLANTLKMKIYIQQRLVNPSAISSFDAIATTGNYIQEGEDFVFNWGSTLDNPNSRHPLYNAQYAPGGPATWYMSNWLMDRMLNGQSIEDPRIRYYFYRQVGDVLSNVNPDTGEEKRCVIQTIPPHYDNNDILYCYPDNDRGYWGRDHGSNEGIPPDGFLRTAFGIYPAGGRFDDSSFEIIDGNNYGAEGYGVTPIILASTVDFWRAEAALYGGAGSADQFLESAINKHIDYVRTFSGRSAQDFDESTIPDASDDVDYVSSVIAEFNSSADREERLDVLGEQFLISLIGNGTDAYNFYRRTGAPRDIQPNIEPNPGAFPRSMWYPAGEVTANPNVSQKDDLTVRVFWDDNPISGFPVNN
ncbi:SusD/RagB family nutrient-binding outer membrane lipoprotein [Psychroflexus sp. CAK57W]|uniref:SusD/RagB family nutrient-binding outer membrane lipoprotein n=1 Tax=Psychroflexus curvus TaxID=2873595 RepID=UPI001CCC3C8C|nr:SusD/RagB family nutrient-binding outer membrane lipoprotein [Psychroflexus curvus]MBZ9788273.1 SusD/RagB family nutrient-binding outer membrane lipoprotein [Psychroflexus curvus]